MLPSLRIPISAKTAAANALRQRERLPASKRFGLDENEAGSLGINSGVARAKQIISSSYLPYYDAVSVARFYSRFRNCHTDKCNGAIGLWGGRRFGQKAVEFVRKVKA